MSIRYEKRHTALAAICGKWQREAGVRLDLDNIFQPFCPKESENDD